MEALTYITEKYSLNLKQRSPIEIPNIGRDGLAILFAKLGYTKGAEIGVEQGLYAEMLCKANPDLRLYAIDAWRAYRGYRDHVSQDKLDNFYKATMYRLAPYDCEIIREFSMDAVKQTPDDSLDFVYIDGNHELPYVINDIIEWSKKVRKGGIVSGHDYYQSTRFDTKNHTVYAVDAYTRSYRITPWFLLGTKAKTPGMVRDTARSWMWVKA